MRIATQKQNVPILRFPEFNGEWKEKRIGDVLKVGSGRDYKHLGAGNIPVYGTGGYMTSVDEYLYDGESVCIGRKGTIDKPVYLNEKFWTVDTLFYTHSFKDSVPKFIYAIFQSINWKQHNEGSGVPSLSKTTIEKIKIEIPKPEEQKKIASFLSSVDKKIEQLGKKKKLLEQYKKGMMQKLFTQQIRFKDENGNDYYDWQEKQLDDVADVVMGTSPESKFYNSNSEGLPLIQGNADIKNRKSSPRIFTSIITKECFEKDVLLTVRAPVGEVSISQHHACIGRGMCAIRAKDSNIQEFIYQFLLWFEPRWKSLSQGSTFESVNTGDIKSLSVLTPRPEEQAKIANFLSVIDDKINLIAAELNHAKTFKKGLLQQMFV